MWPHFIRKKKYKKKNIVWCNMDAPKWNLRATILNRLERKNEKRRWFKINLFDLYFRFLKTDICINWWTCVFFFCFERVNKRHLRKNVSSHYYKQNIHRFPAGRTKTWSPKLLSSRTGGVDVVAASLLPLAALIWLAVHSCMRLCVSYIVVTTSSQRIRVNKYYYNPMAPVWSSHVQCHAMSLSAF